MRRGGEGGVGRGQVTVFVVEAEITRNAVMQARRRGPERCGHVRHRRQHVVVDHDLLSGVLCLCLGVGHDDRHGVTDIKDATTCQGRNVRGQERHAAPPCVGYLRLATAISRLMHVIAGQHG